MNVNNSDGGASMPHFKPMIEYTEDPNEPRTSFEERIERCRYCDESTMENHQKYDPEKLVCMELNMYCKDINQCG